MALKKIDDKKYQSSLKRNADKYFGKGANEKPFLRNVVSGATRGLSFGFNPKESDTKFALSMGQLLIVAMPALVISGTITDRQDFTVPHDAAISTEISEESGAQIYGISGQHYFEGNKYMLINGEDGYQLYTSSAEEFIGPDNRFSLVTSPLEATEIAASMVARYNMALADDDNSPYLITYEGISPIYEEDKSQITEVANLYPIDLRHRIADDFVETVEEYDMQPHMHIWQEAMTQFAGGDTAVVNVEIEGLSDHYDTQGRELLESLGLFLAIYGGLTGLGAVAGAAHGASSSRRRFNKEISLPKP